MAREDSPKMQELAELLRDDPAPKELEITILPLPLPNDNSADEGTETDAASGTSFMKEGIHLGIHAPHLPTLAKEFRKIYYSRRKEIEISRSKQSISKGAHTHVHGDHYFLDCISCLLLLCPDHATAWADRRRLLIPSLPTRQTALASFQSVHEFWSAEIRFLNLLYTQHSKAPNAWAHRRWVCRKILDSFRDHGTGVDDIHHVENEVLSMSEDLLLWATREIALCTVIAEKYPKNYYAWTHRSFIVRSLVNMMQDREKNIWLLKYCADDLLSLLETEVQSVEPWLQRHVSDHSAVHYGGEVLSLWLSNENIISNGHDGDDRWKFSILERKLEESQTLIEKYPSHEVIWIWRRICSRLFLDHASSSASASASASFIEQEWRTYESISESSDENCSEEEIMHRHHSFTYILWILKYAKFKDIKTSLAAEEILLLEKNLLQMEESRGNGSTRHIWDLVSGNND